MSRYHLKEIDWVIYFPRRGNEGREMLKYGVAYRDRVNKKGQPGPKAYLHDVMVLDAIKKGYPHTVGRFQNSSGKGRAWRPEYLETRVVKNEKELLEWFQETEMEMQ